MRDLQKTPGNALLAVALHDVLGDVGDGPRRARVEELLGRDGAFRRRRADWIRPELLCDIFHEAGVDARLARRVGRALVAPRGLGLLLCYAGIATPEKAYRRVDHLLARERPGGRFVADDVALERARIEFHPKEPRAADAIFCAVRLGMLEALPSLYGLLPAKVREAACAHRGDPHCAFDVEWRTVPRTWLGTGAASGLACGAALGAALGGGALGPAGWTLAAALAGAVLGGAAGRSVDLSRQLRAVARNGIGHLALLDQADGVLAEKMDALAKLERTPEGARPAAGPGARATRGGASGQGGAERAHPVAPDLLRRFGDALATLQRALARLAAQGADAETELAVCAEASRSLRAVGVALSEGAEAAGDEPPVADLVEIVRRGVDAARPGLPRTLEIALALEVDAAPIRGHALPLEGVVAQLVANAAAAVGGEGTVGVALRASPDGFELAISDAGEGIDPEILDRLFDPFFDAASAPSAADARLGLARCYRVVDRLGGELSVQSEPERGTTVTVALPADWEAPVGAGGPS